MAMSRSATPALRKAASTRAIALALLTIADLASRAVVTTPAEIIATSGVRFTLPCATMSSRVPVTTGPVTSALAIDGMAAIAAASAMIVFI